MVNKTTLVFNFESLFQKLLSATKEGKLAWAKTATPGTFVAAVKGRQTFELSVRREPDAYGRHEMLTAAAKLSVGTKLPDPLWVFVSVKDKDGEPMYESPGMSSSVALELHKLASYIAGNVGEKLQESLELLEQL